MKSNALKSKEVVKMSDAELLSLVASKLKGRVLFPRKIEEAKQYLQKVKFITS